MKICKLTLIHYLIQFGIFFAPILVGISLQAAPIDKIVLNINSQIKTEQDMKNLDAWVKWITPEHPLSDATLDPQELRLGLQQKFLQQMVVNSYAKSLGINITPYQKKQLIQKAIASKDMSSETFFKQAAEKHIDQKFVEDQIVAEAISEYVYHFIMNEKVKISREEIEKTRKELQKNAEELYVEYILLQTNNPDAFEKINLKIHDASTLEEQVRSINKANDDQHSIIVDKIRSQTNKIPNEIQSELIDLPTKTLSKVIEYDHQYFMIFIIQKPLFTNPTDLVPQYHAFEIVTKEEHLAHELKTKIMNKTLSFGEAAEQFSQNSRSAAKKGDLGWCALEEINPALFQKAITELHTPVGPIKTPDGFMILMITEKKIDYLPLKKQQSIIRNNLKASKTPIIYTKTITDHMQNIFLSVPELNISNYA